MKVALHTAQASHLQHFPSCFFELLESAHPSPGMRLWCPKDALSQGADGAAGPGANRWPARQSVSWVRLLTPGVAPNFSREEQPFQVFDDWESSSTHRPPAFPTPGHQAQHIGDFSDSGLSSTPIGRIFPTGSHKHRPLLYSATPGRQAPRQSSCDGSQSSSTAMQGAFPSRRRCARCAIALDSCMLQRLFSLALCDSSQPNCS